MLIKAGWAAYTFTRWLVKKLYALGAEGMPTR